MCLFCSKRSALALLPVLAMGTLSSLSFYWGGAAEEFCIPFMAWSLYMSIRYFKEDYPEMPEWKMILLNGIFAGIIMQVKYIMMGFYWFAAFCCFDGFQNIRIDCSLSQECNIFEFSCFFSKNCDKFFTDNFTLALWI